MDEPLKREFRYERKFLVEELDSHQVRVLISQHPYMFYELYPPRVVNNIYLDSEQMDSYQSNVCGIGERRKVRIRWYGDLFGEIAKPMLEFKVRDGTVGAKYSYPFPSFRLDRDFSQDYFQHIVHASDLPGNVRYILHSLNVVLCNTYYRRYYSSRDQRFRVTVDKKMVYFQIKKTNNRFRIKFEDPNRVIVELKYEKQFDPQADQVANYFPFSVTKNSKYVTGIENVYP